MGRPPPIRATGCTGGKLSILYRHHRRKSVLHVAFGESFRDYGEDVGEAVHTRFALHPSSLFVPYAPERLHSHGYMRYEERGYRCPNPPFPLPRYGHRLCYLNRTFVGPLAQPLFKQAPRRLTPLHTCDHAVHGSQPDAPQHLTHDALC